MASNAIQIEAKEYFDDMHWADECYLELQKKYKDCWIAIVDREVISFGKDLAKVKKEAFDKTGRKDIPVIFVESGSHIY